MFRCFCRSIVEKILASNIYDLFVVAVIMFLRFSFLIWQHCGIGRLVAELINFWISCERFLVQCFSTICSQNYFSLELLLVQFNKTPTWPLISLHSFFQATVSTSLFCWATMGFLCHCFPKPSKNFLLALQIGEGFNWNPPQLHALPLEVARASCTIPYIWLQFYVIHGELFRVRVHITLQHFKTIAIHWASASKE